jgi:hypothetical protein
MCEARFALLSIARPRAIAPGDPILLASGGPPGIIRTIEECFPRSARQRCLAHRMRNLAVKVRIEPSAKRYTMSKLCPST